MGIPSSSPGRRRAQSAKTGSAGANVILERPVRVGPGAGGVLTHITRDDFDSKSEDLGKKNVEGVMAQGTRTTVTIPAGAIGNEQPIETVSERWYSDELKTVVMTKSSDTRFGETTYRLSNIRRGEPSPDLFEVPSDYKVEEMPGPDMMPKTIRMREKK